jgi:SAM-dependent methyltransferase
MMSKRIMAPIRRLVGRRNENLDSAKAYFFRDARGDGSGAVVDKRWQEIPIVADLRPTDIVLDIGCAEGLVALRIAKSVHHVHGIDPLEHRIEAAYRFAGEQRVRNVSFTVASIVTCELRPREYDVVLFLGIYGRAIDSGRIGTAELGKALEAVGRQIVMRVDVQDDPEALRYLDEIFACFDKNGFDGICFPKVAPDVGNIILGNRRESGARIRYLPPLILSPSNTRDLAILHEQDGYETEPGIWGRLLGHYSDAASK